MQGLWVVPIGLHLMCRHRHAQDRSGADATKGWTGRTLDVPSGEPWFAAIRLHCVADAALHAMALSGMRQGRLMGGTWKVRRKD